MYTSYWDTTLGLHTWSEDAPSQTMLKVIITQGDTVMPWEIADGRIYYRPLVKGKN